MTRKLWNIGILAALALTLAACAQVGSSPTLAAGEQSAVLGDGGGYTSGSFTEGLVVVGTGQASAEPQIAQVTFGVELRGDDVAALVDEAATKINQAIAAAKGMGVADEDVQTVSYSVWVETIYDPQSGVPTGEVVYHVSHYVQATLRDLDRVGGLLAAVVNAGANTISNVNFSVEDPDTLIEQARQEALQNARSQAQAMAQALGVTLGKPISVMETGGGYPVVREAAVGMGGGGMAAAPSITPGAFSVSVSVQIVYEIR